MNSGVYQILNKINNKSYVGSAVNLKNRKLQHFSNLRKNKHTNEYLQNSWNKYGEDCFEFIVLATCPKEYCIKLEQWFIDNLSNLFNIQKKANSSFGRPCKLETKLKHSENRINYKHSIETKNKITNSLLNNKRCVGKKQKETTIKLRISSDGYVDFMLKKQKKILQMNKNNEPIKIFNSVHECSDQLKINVGDLSKICNNVKGYKTYKGFKFKYI